MPGKKERCRLEVSRGIQKGLGVDREENVIKGVSVISVGPALGHGMEIDKTTVKQVVELGNKHKGGVKSRLGHPNMSFDAMGTMLGRIKNFRSDDDGKRARGDLYISPTAFKSPKGDIGTYVMEMAEKESDMFGMSVVINVDLEAREDKDGNELEPLVRVNELLAADVVDEPATGDELFSMFDDSVQPSAEATKFIQGILELPDCMEKVESFLDKFNANEAQKKKVLNKIEKALEKNNEEQNKLSIKPDEGDLMTPEEKLEAEKKAKLAREKEIKEAKELAKKEALEAEKNRIKQIDALCKSLSLPSEFAEELRLSELSLEQCKDKIIEKKAELQEVPKVNVKLGGDNHEKQIEALSNSILVSTGVEKDKKVREDVRKTNFNGITLQKLAVHCLQNDGCGDMYFLGADALWNKMAEYGYFAAGTPTQGSGDFVNVLSNVLNKSVNLGWELAESTFEQWVGTGSLKDFKTADLVRLSEIGDVNRIYEGQAPKMANLTDTKEQARLETWGGQSILSRQVFVNDDLGQFTTVAQMWARSMRRKMNRLAYYHLYDGTNDKSGTAFAGQTMLEDNAAQFNSTAITTAGGHNNLASGAGRTAITQAALDTAWKAFRRQRALSPDGKADPIHLNIKPKYCLVGPENELALWKVLNDLGYSTSSDDNDGTGSIAKNIHAPGAARSLTPVVDAILDDIDTDRYPWWLVADQNMVGCLNLYTLNGDTTPFSDSAPTPLGAARGMQFVIEHDFVFHSPDWRGGYCNPGAAKS